MEILNPSAFEYGVARFTLPGQEECGDDHVVWNRGRDVLLAVVDGLGHGREAAAAAKLATSALAHRNHDPAHSLVYSCHDHLRGTRGVALSLAFVDPERGLMTWLGIGNVQGFLVRRDPRERAYQQSLLLRAGIVGIQLPVLQPALLPVVAGDTLVFATDGIRGPFVESLSPLEAPKKAADRILRQYCSGNDDALVLVARFSGKAV
jgi:serine phosphatase RsbU (regulator of sigma subunit)